MAEDQQEYAACLVPVGEFLEIALKAYLEIEKEKVIYAGFAHLRARIIELNHLKSAKLLIGDDGVSKFLEVHAEGEIYEVVRSDDDGLWLRYVTQKFNPETARLRSQRLV